jgi:hypothetical protein
VVVCYTYQSAQTTEEIEEAERNRQKVLEGTAVTPESFAIWKVRLGAGEVERKQPREVISYLSI